MKVVLVNPPRSESDLFGVTPPLGLLSLASAATNDHDVKLVDYNLLWHVDKELHREFFTVAATQLALLDADVYGFTSMAVDSHIAIELAREVKRLNPKGIVVLGGTHFSSIAASVIAQFPWVDFVVVGEGEKAFIQLLRELGDSCVLTREVRVGQQSASDVPPQMSLDIIDFLPYLRLNPAGAVDFESGRGCKFKCTFCYSPNHYSTVQFFAVDRTIEHLAALKRQGVRHVFFVQDNFLNDPSK